MTEFTINIFYSKNFGVIEFIINTDINNPYIILKDQKDNIISEIYLFKAEYKSNKKLSSINKNKFIEFCKSINLGIKEHNDLIETNWQSALHTYNVVNNLNISYKMPDYNLL